MGILFLGHRFIKFGFCIINFLGMPLSPLQRFLDPEYADGTNIPRGGLTNSSLPSARNVSVAVHQGLVETNLMESISLLVMQFGQFLNHDITLTPDGNKRCCDQSILAEENKKSEELRSCFNFDISNDNFYRSKIDCHPFTRQVSN